jgi:hypothetical protein
VCVCVCRSEAPLPSLARPSDLAVGFLQRTLIAHIHSR